MPIHDRAIDLAQRIRKAHKRSPYDLAYHFQERSDIDGRHRWLCVRRIDIQKLTRDEDLQAVAQCLLINHQIIDPSA